MTERLSSAKTISRFWIISSAIGFLTILFRFSQCWNQASDSGEEGESIDEELIDSATDMKKAAVIQYLTLLPNYREQIVKLPNPWCNKTVVNMISCNVSRVLEELLGPLGLAVNQDMEEGKLNKVVKSHGSLETISSLYT